MHRPSRFRKIFDDLQERGERCAINRVYRLMRNEAEPNKGWVTDITCLHAHEGWIYLAVVIDLFSRQVIA